MTVQSRPLPSAQARGVAQSWTAGLARPPRTCKGMGGWRGCMPAGAATQPPAAGHLATPTWRRPYRTASSATSDTATSMRSRLLQPGGLGGVGQGGVGGVAVEGGRRVAGRRHRRNWARVRMCAGSAQGPRLSCSGAQTQAAAQLHCTAAVTLLTVGRPAGGLSRSSRLLKAQRRACSALQEAER